MRSARVSPSLGPVAPSRHRIIDVLAFASLTLFVFTIPWEKTIYFPDLGTLSRFVGLAAFGLGALALFRGTGIRVRPLPLYLLAAFLLLIWMVATLTWTADRDASMEYLITLAQLVAMSWLIWQQTKSKERRGTLLHAYVLGCLVSVVNTIVQFLAGSTVDYSSQTRFAAPGFHPNYLATTFALAIPMAWHLFRTARRPLARWINILAIPASILGILLTGSRGGAITAAVALVIIPLSYPYLRRSSRAVLWTMVVIVAALSYAFTPVFEKRLASGLQRLGEISQQVSEGDLTGRVEIWRAGLLVARDNALVGSGAGAYATAVEPHLGTAITAHNAFINILVGSGLVGLGLFVLMLGLLLAPLLKLPPGDRVFLLVLYGVVIISLLPSTLEDGKQIWFSLSVAACWRAYVLPSGVAAERSPLYARPAR